MSEKELLQALSAIDDDLITEAEQLPGKRRHSLRWMAAAVCAVITVCIGIGMYCGQNDTIALERSEGDVSVQIVSELPKADSADCLAYLTEDELITDSQTDIFRGTIVNIQNVVVSCGESESYHAIVEIEVGQVYRTFGNCTAGDMVSVLTNPIHMDGIGVSASDTIEQAQIGMNCIFMANLLDSSDMKRHGESTLYWTDIAEYRMPDAIRYAFLETENGVIFDRDSYPSFCDADTLDEIMQGIEKLIS